MEVVVALRVVADSGYVACEGGAGGVGGGGGAGDVGDGCGVCASAVAIDQTEPHRGSTGSVLGCWCSCMM